MDKLKERTNMTIYILERDNPYEKPEPEVSTEKDTLLSVMRTEYENQMKELGVTQQQADKRGPYCSIEEDPRTGIGSALIDRGSDGDRWEWRITSQTINMPEKPKETQEKQNTKIDYLYRDKYNYKSYQTVVLNGLLTNDQITEILQSLPDHAYFIPEYLDFPSDRNWGFDPQVDDAFWEMDKNSFSETTAKPTIECTPDDIVKRFCELESKWNSLGTNYPSITKVV